MRPYVPVETCRDTSYWRIGRRARRIGAADSPRQRAVEAAGPGVSKRATHTKNPRFRRIGELRWARTSA